MLTKIKNFFNKEEKMDPVTENISDDISGNKTANRESNSEDMKSEESKTETVSNDTKVEAKKEYPLEEIKEEVIKVLKTCYDPEIPVDVWELGLIYEINVATNGDVLIVMTLTSPSCPVAGILPGEIEQKVKDHPMVNDCKVQLTFDPPWSQNNMSEVAKLELGFL